MFHWEVTGEWWEAAREAFLLLRGVGAGWVIIVMCHGPRFFKKISRALPKIREPMYKIRMSRVLKEIFTTIKKESCPDFFKSVQGTQPIILHIPNGPEIREGMNILHRKKEGLFEVKEQADILLKHSLPFANQFIELSKCIIDVNRSEGIYIKIAGILVKEDAPNQITCAVYCGLKDDADVKNDAPWRYAILGAQIPIRETFHTLLPESYKYVILRAFSTVNYCLELLNSRTEYGETPANFVLKKGVGKAASRTEIRKIVHIRPYKSQATQEYDGLPIDWSHRWKVRGHWRKIHTVGKNREGEYGVHGFTWVVDHVKGPEDAPLVEKTYVLDSEAFPRAT